MNDLKTLKEIQGTIGFIAKGNFSHKRVGQYIRECIEIEKNQIKAEAIKWVKHYKDPALKDYFMDFFNLTEENLK